MLLTPGYAEQRGNYFVCDEDMIVDNIGSMNENQRFIGVEPIDLSEKPRVKRKPPMTNIPEILVTWLIQRLSLIHI